MKKLLITIAILASACTANKPHADITFGARNFESNTQWQQMDNQPAIGLQANMAGENSFGPECGFLLSSDSSLNNTYVNRRTDHATSTVREYFLGLRKNFKLSDKWQFFVSGGAAYAKDTTLVMLSYQGDVHVEGSEVFSPYAQAGLNYNLGHGYTCGLVARRDFWGAGQSVFTTHPPSDSMAYLLTFGYTF